jgi:hypothetical protein
MYTGAIGREMVVDSNVDRVPPASLDPRTWVHSIEYLCISEVYPISIDPVIRDIQLIVASDANGCKAFVIGTNIEFSPVKVPKPAPSIVRTGARRPSFHIRVVTDKV